MSRRLSLRDLHDLIVDELDDDWRTSTWFADQLGLGHGDGWVRVALTLERLAADGKADLQGYGTRVHRFRRRRSACS